jgi:hypothetical protein
VKSWGKHEWLALAAIVALSFAFRFPALLNASGVNSDAAIVGLQAMHVLRGEHAVFLWGSGYQTSVDSYWAALLFAIFGAKPVVLVLSSLSLHVVLTVLAWDVVRRHVRCPWIAAGLVLPLILSTAAVHSYALNPPRQASLTLAMAAIALADRKKSLLAGLVALLAFYADPYAVLLIPALALWWRDWRMLLGGAAMGAIPVMARMLHPAAQHGIFSMTPSVLAHNAKLLADPCGPWFLGTTIWIDHGTDWGPWHAPIYMRALQLLGGAAFFAVIGASLALAFRDRKNEAARIAVAGGIVMVLTLAGFLVSQMVMDEFSMRYLAAIALVMPFVATPLALRLEPKRFFPLYAPFVATSALCGWLTFTPYVNGAFPARDPSATGEPENALAAQLAERGVSHAIADYWVAYRTTFVTREGLVVVPLHASQDRRGSYRNDFESAEKFAYVFDSTRSGEDEAATAQEYEKTYETVDRVGAGNLRAIIFARTGAAARTRASR